MTDKNKKKGLSKLFGAKKKKGSCCCDLEFEEIPTENNKSNDKSKAAENQAVDKEDPSCCK
jgi:hypothetical protein